MMTRLPTVMTADECEELEKLVDRYGLDSICATLASICTVKAEHIRTNWQDKDLAARWDGAEGRFDALSTWLASNLP